MSFVLAFDQSLLMCTSRAGRREACFAAFVFLCLLKYTLPIIAGFLNNQNLEIMIPGSEEEKGWDKQDGEWDGEDEEEEEVNDWSRCFVERLLEWEERGSALSSRTLAFFRFMCTNGLDPSNCLSLFLPLPNIFVWSREYLV